uniref:Secreted protein n=1 Tax=Ditylenchus dipsaci TaxID=166011 RepID=A0A915E647_9BILA
MIRRATYMFALPKSTNQFLVLIFVAVSKLSCCRHAGKPSTSRVRCDRRIAQEFHVNEADFLEIRDAAVGSVQATESAIYRAKRKKYPPLRLINHAIRLTLQGSETSRG